MVSTATGNEVAGSRARYLPFGGWRTEPTTPLTNRGFTGHPQNNLGSGDTDLGLIYMNARYYLPHIGRFLSADTLIPDPANPQSFNRYAYVLNNPLRFTDPTGHSCANPSYPDESWDCRLVERDILRSTVRMTLTIRVLKDGRSQESVQTSHATVKDGQYLVTHNHFTRLGAADSFDIISAQLFTADGQEMYSGTANFITISRYADAPETLLLDLGIIGEVMLEGNGVVSADFGLAKEMGVKEGDEVAQIIWNRDEQETTVGWGEVLDIDDSVIQTTNVTPKGSSGGGVFYHGRHIGNNWALVDRGEEQFGRGALNSLTVAK